MRAITGFPHFAFCILPFAFAGCTDTHRANDWADVITATVGDGVGAKARLGPFQTGLYSGNDMAGLRSGETGEHWGRVANYDCYWLVTGREHFDGWIDDRGPVLRHKVVAAESFFPCIVIPEAPHPYRREDFFDARTGGKLTDGSKNHAYWTQFEIALGLSKTVRFGFNPGELLDALLGHLGVDLYDDDNTPEEEAIRRESLLPGKTAPKEPLPIYADPQPGNGTR